MEIDHKLDRATRHSRINLSDSESQNFPYLGSFERRLRHEGNTVCTYHIHTSLKTGIYLEWNSESSLEFEVAIAHGPCHPGLPSPSTSTVFGLSIL